jgi:hypothetical protein
MYVHGGVRLHRPIAITSSLIIELVYIIPKFKMGLGAPESSFKAMRMRILEKAP